MKKIILTLFTIATLAVNAQDNGFKKGDFALNGELSNFTSKILDLSVSPSMMYFVSNNFALKGGLMFNSNDDKTAGVSTGSNSGFGIGLGGNYYFKNGGLSPFIGGGINFMSGSEKNAAGVETMKNSGFGLNVMPGVNCFVSKRFAFNATFGNLGYNSNSETDAAGVETVKSGFGLDLNVNTAKLGMTFVFN